MHSSMLRTMRSPTVATDMMRITQIGTYSPKLCYVLYLDPPGDNHTHLRYPIIAAVSIGHLRRIEILKRSMNWVQDSTG